MERTSKAGNKWREQIEKGASYLILRRSVSTKDMQELVKGNNETTILQIL